MPRTTAAQPPIVEESALPSNVRGATVRPSTSSAAMDGRGGGMPWASGPPRSHPLTPSSSMPSMTNAVFRPDTPEMLYNRQPPMVGGPLKLATRPSRPMSGERLPGLQNAPVPSELPPAEPANRKVGGPKVVGGVGRLVDKSVDRMVDSLIANNTANEKGSKPNNLPSLTYPLATSPYMPPPYVNAADERRRISPYDEAQKLRVEIQKVRATCERRLAQAEEEMKQALERQYMELTAGAEEQQQMRLAREREERIEHLRRLSVRRVLNRSLGLGWQSWLVFWEARADAMGRLQRLRERNLAARMLAPELAASFLFWASLFDARRQAALKEALEKRIATLEAELLAAAAERNKALERQLTELCARASRQRSDGDESRGGSTRATHAHACPHMPHVPTMPRAQDGLGGGPRRAARGEGEGGARRAVPPHVCAADAQLRPRPRVECLV